MVNLQKSTLTFGGGVDLDTQQCLCSSLQIPLADTKHGKYLGLPYIIGRSKQQVFFYLWDWVSKKVGGRKERLLSQAGSAVMFKAIPVYAVLVFLLLESLIHQLISEIRKFWWGTREHHSIPWMSWKKLYRTMSQRGIDFWDLHACNLALLEKQA